MRHPWIRFGGGILGIGVVVLMLSSNSAVSAVSAASAAPQGHASSPCGQVSIPPHYKHVIVIMDENRSYGQIIGNPAAPYINGLAEECGLASNYHNITHASLPNYIGITSGLKYRALVPFDHDCQPSECSVASRSLFSEETSWKEYAEGMPANCDSTDSGQYAARHNPAVYFTRLQDCATNDVPLGTTKNSALLSDFLKESTAPAFSYVTGNLCDDMHGNQGCPPGVVQAGDQWLSTWMPLLTATPVYRKGDTAILLLWDEGSGGQIGERCQHETAEQSCHVAAVMIAPSVAAHTMVDKHFTHYSALKTIEDLLGLHELGAARRATSMVDGFNL